MLVNNKDFFVMLLTVQEAKNKKIKIKKRYMFQMSEYMHSTLDYEITFVII